MKHHQRHRCWVLAVGVVPLLFAMLAATLAPPLALADPPSPSPKRAVQRAWQAAQRLGDYHFTSEVAQTTFPAPSLANFGRSSRQETFYLEGDVNLPARAMTMRLWGAGGSLADPNTAMELRLEGDHGFIRQPGGTWQEADDVGGGFAPNNDMLAYLAGLKNVRQTGGSEPDTPQAGPGPRYSFEFDGPAFALYLRDQLETYLRQRGELPLNLTLDSSRVYRETTGHGEIWLDDRGLPLRLIIHLAYPQQDNGERVEADIKTDFGFRISDFGFETAHSPLSTLHSLTSNLQSAICNLQSAIRIGLLLGVLGLVLLVLIRRRSKPVYTAIVLAVIFSMVAVPLLQSQQAAAFFQRQAARQAEYEQQQDQQKAARDLRAELTGANWDPHRDPLRNSDFGMRNSDSAIPNPQSAIRNLQSEATTPTDTDNDGLTDADERDILGTDPAVADSDGDGLSDGVEVLRLGTNPLFSDSDDDGISDKVELTGFRYDNKPWYLNALNPDSNGDGLTDGAECPALAGVSSAPASVSCDNDGDMIPDPFDYDDDGDGAPDRVDISPNSVLDRTGKRASKGNVTPFDAQNPFKLQVSGLTNGEPALVDLQLRPVNETHLTYAMNVLDWPANDDDGQIQHVKNTTFADTDNLQSRNTSDPRSQNGDMRLIPMLEIKLSGSQLPFKLTTPATTVEVRGDISATVALTQQAGDANKTVLEWTLGDSGGYYVGIDEGRCPATPSTTPSDYQCSASSGDGSCTIDGKLTGLADGEHYLVFTESASKWSCRTIGNIVNGPYTDKMIDPEPLQPYGISVREADAEGTPAAQRVLLAYVPLNVAPDDTGGGRAAFSARMIYWPTSGATWAQAQEVRVAWLVQVLTDACDRAGFQPSTAAEDDASQFNSELDAWCADPANRTADRAQIVHTYDEQWYLTGLSVREERGLDVAIVWEDPDPANDNDRQSDDRLWQAARGLMAVFVPGRDCEDDLSGTNPDYAYDPSTSPATETCHTDSKRDLVVATGNDGNTTVYDRLDSSGSVPDGDERRWAIPKKALQVETFSYDHQDYIAWIAMHETRDILEQHFDAYKADTTPTLLFAREETFRSANLEGSNGLVSDLLILDLSSEQPRTMTSLSWAPFRYNSDAGPDGQPIGWEDYPISEFWDKMELAFKAGFRNIYPDEDDSTIIGRMAVARGIYVSFYTGLTGLVKTNGSLTWAPPWTIGEAFDDSDSALAEEISGIINNSYWVSIEFVNDFAEAFLEAFRSARGASLLFGQTGAAQHATDLFSSVGDGLKGIAQGWISAFNPSNTFGQLGGFGKVGLGIIFGVAAAAVILSVVAAAQSGDPLEIVGYVLTALNTVVLLKGLLGAVKQAIEAGMSSVKTAITTASEWTKGFSSKVAIVGLIIGVAVTWAIVGVTLGLGWALMSHIERAETVVAAVADTIVLVIMFVVYAIPIVGAIIATVIWLIDTLVGMICTVALSAEQQESEAAGWLCGGLEGIVSNVLAWLFYAGTVMVDIDAEDRFQISGLDANDLVYPDIGLAVGQKVKVAATFTNTIALVDLPENVGKAYWYQYSDERLRSSTFDYRMQDTETPLHEGLERYTMDSEWGYVDGTAAECGSPCTYHKPEPVFITETVRSTDGIPLDAAGINRSLPAYVSEGWAIPAQECVLDVCGIRTERDSRHYPLGEGLRLDVFPATLDGFYELTPKGGGWSLAWGQDGVVSFPTMRDADGDGVPNGADQHDDHWDNDLDGVSDWYELLIGSDPDEQDSDGDGLRDDLELRVGTNAARADSDGDGLLDGEEVWHQDLFDKWPPPAGNGNTAEWVGGWNFVYAVKADGTAESVWVFPDPLAVDRDQDTLTDFQEKLFGLHPEGFSNPRVLTLESSVKELSASGVYSPTDGFVKPGDPLRYEATVRNDLLNRYAQGLLTTDLPAALSTSGELVEDFLLYPQSEHTLNGDVSVAGTATTGVYSLTQVAGALITDWSELAGGARLWLPFEEPLGQDRSGSIPPHDGTCVGTCTSATGKFGSSLRLDGSGYMTSDLRLSTDAYALSLWFKSGLANGTLFAEEHGRGRQVYLSTGRVCADLYVSGFGWEKICGSTILNDGNWHHLVHTFGGTVGSQKLYVEGIEETQGSRTGSSHACQCGVFLGHSTLAGRTNFNGLLDDVRLFDTALSDSEVRSLFNEPVFRAKFDENSGWKDYSVFANQVSCSGSSCPSRVDGVTGKSASFSGSQYLSVDPDPSLNMSGGRFTIAAWIRPNEPTNSSGEMAATKQGILGYDSGQASAFPSLQWRQEYKSSMWYRSILFGFGTPDGWAGTLTYEQPMMIQGNLGWQANPDFLKTDAWTHIALVLADGVAKVYVNGRHKYTDSSTFAGAVPGGTRRFTLGQSNATAKLTVGSITVTDEGDGTQTEGELCMAFKSGGSWLEIFDQDVKGDSKNPSVYQVSDTRTVNGQASLKMWEDDGGERCVTSTSADYANPRDDGDDKINDDAVWSFSIGEASKTGTPSFSGGAAGSFTYSFSNDSIPYKGRLDEVQIYQQPLDDDAVADLYRETALALHLSLDDPPGETVFKNAMDPNHQGTCSGQACPTAGVNGRVNQAAWFQSAENDRLSIANGPANRLTNDLTVAAWIRPDSLSGVQRIVSTSRTGSNNGWGFGTDGSNLRYTTWGIKDYNATGIGLQAGRWTHVAAVMDAANTVAFYVDGTLAVTVTHSAPGVADTDDKLLIGAATAVGSASLVQPFGGRIDDVQVFRTALGAGEILRLYRRAPLFHMRFEEARGATHFADDSGNGHTGTCSGNACPAVGFALQGRLGQAASFDGGNDMIHVNDAADLQIRSFSVGAWVMPSSGGKSTAQDLVTKAGATDGLISAITFRLAIQANRLTPFFQVGYACNPSWQTAPWTAVSTVPLIQSGWNHVMGTYDQATGRLQIYVNGSKQGETIDSYRSPCNGTLELQIGGLTNLASSRFAGRMDEVTVYNHALSQREVRELFQYQGGWVEDRQSHDLTVDSDTPVSEVLIPATYLPKAGVQLLVTAGDATSGVAEAELGWCRSALPCSAGNWATAPACQDATSRVLPAEGGGAAWCPTFTPSSEGRHTLGARATDLVGNPGHSLQVARPSTWTTRLPT